MWSERLRLVTFVWLGTVRSSGQICSNGRVGKNMLGKRFLESHLKATFLSVLFSRAGDWPYWRPRVNQRQAASYQQTRSDVEAKIDKSTSQKQSFLPADVHSMTYLQHLEKFFLPLLSPLHFLSVYLFCLLVEFMVNRSSWP